MDVKEVHVECRLTRPASTVYATNSICIGVTATIDPSDGNLEDIVQELHQRLRKAAEKNLAAKANDDVCALVTK